MKTIFNLKKIALLTFFAAMIVLFDSCKKVDEIEPDPIDTKECSTYGTIIYMPCWYSAYDGFWIKLDDGTLMRPCESAVFTTQAQSFKEEQRIKFGYELSDCSIDQNPNALCCFVYPPEPPAATSIKVTCLEFIDEEPEPVLCNLTGIVKNYQDENCGVKVIEFYESPGTPLKTIEPVDQSLFANLNVDDQVTFSYNIVETFAPTCSGNPAAEITCLNGGDGGSSSDCKPIVITNTNLSMVPVYSPVMIQEVYIEDNCLKIKGGFSGCSNDVSRFDMIWDGNFMLSSPPQVNLYITDYDPITCMAYFENTLSFDISKLKENYSGPIIINIFGWTGTITF